ncbi:MAG: RNA polymerase sigma factor [Chloroflexi bacterium]|nr:RNA polymerase sigma factor [Chloroflexota bacterium]
MSNRHSDAPSNDSLALYEACHSPDPQTRDSGYERLWRDLYPIALQMVRDQPQPEALAKDYAQEALLRVYRRSIECREPTSFLAWARSIVRHLVIDDMRRRRKLAPLDESDDASLPLADDAPTLEIVALENLGHAELRRLISRAPISERSRRVILGMLDDIPDERLAQAESGQSGRSVRPSHVQVTRSKDIADIRKYLGR